MASLFVTLEVSKLSGWLNTEAPCRESKGEHSARGIRCGPREVRDVAGDRGANGVQGRLEC